MKKHPGGIFALMAGMVTLSSSIAGASMINQFDTLFPAPGEPGPIGGTLLAESTVPVLAPTFSGLLTSSVIADDSSNPLGGLTFTYLLMNDAPSAHPIGRFTVNGFEGFQADASYQTPATGRIPTLINRPTPNVIGYNFIAMIGPGVLAAGDTSALLVIQTNSTVFSPDIASFIDGTVATVSTFAPAPEPGTFLLLMSLGAAASIRRRRIGR